MHPPARAQMGIHHGLPGGDLGRSLEGGTLAEVQCSGFRVARAPVLEESDRASKSRLGITTRINHGFQR